MHINESQMKIQHLLPKKRDQPLLLSESIDNQVQTCIKNSREQGCIVNATLVIGATLILVITVHVI